MAVRDALCSGDLDFIYSTDGVGTVRFSYPRDVSTDTLYPRNFPDGDAPKYTRGYWPSLNPRPSDLLYIVAGRAAETKQTPLTLYHNRRRRWHRYGRNHERPSISDRNRSSPVGPPRIFGHPGMLEHCLLRHVWRRGCCQFSRGGCAARLLPCGADDHWRRSATSGMAFACAPRASRAHFSPHTLISLRACDMRASLVNPPHRS